MKRVFTFFLLSTIGLTIIYFLISHQKTMYSKVYYLTRISREATENDADVIAFEQLKAQLDGIKNQYIYDVEDWFKSYKVIIKKYAYLFDVPETIYDYYSDDEIYLMQRVVETECYGQDFISKCNVASVVLNRINSGNIFGNTVCEVITKPNQFAYDRENISESTCLAVEYAFEIADTTRGCIAFRSDKKVDSWYGWEYVFTDEAGHHFYK